MVGDSLEMWRMMDGFTPYFWYALIEDGASPKEELEVPKVLVAWDGYGCSEGFHIIVHPFLYLLFQFLGNRDLVQDFLK